MPNQTEVVLTLKIKRSSNTFEGKLLKYLLERYQGQPAAEVILRATSAFWMPFALRDVGKATDQQIKEMGWKAVAELEAQVMYIKRVLQLVEPSPTAINYPLPYYPGAMLPKEAIVASQESETIHPPEATEDLSFNQAEINTDDDQEEYMTPEEIEEVEASGWNMF